MFQIFSQKPSVTFRTRQDLVTSSPHPKPAIKFLPEWFKGLQKDIPKTDKSETGTIKRCIPVLDACSHGFILPLWADLHIRVSHNFKLFDKEKNFISNVQGNKTPDLLGKDFEGKIVDEIQKDGLHIWCKFPTGYDATGSESIGKHTWEQVGDACDLKKFDLGRVLLKLNSPWVIETKRGWSVQFKNPANNWKNDIHFIEGVVDTDEYHQPINFPFVWTGSDVGEWVIPKGEPILQIIPFKRQKIKLLIKPYNLDKMHKTKSLLHSVFKDRYRRFFWHRRSK
jgi:hypothetical protein